uniref:Origin recognition complex subunit 3 N-terminal domain-containing protein n=1 Tax=Trichobilharzia regenti TaxID=157069 RepID=A0AA85J2A4_TRIRE|nr:unnamed protein product [Trichobilharzia regenti]
MADFTVYHGSGKGPEDVPNKRYNQFRDTWKILSSRIEVQTRCLTTNVFTDVYKYIEDSHNSWLTSHHSEEQCTHNIDQIPTAVLLAGVNTPDHSVIYGHLKNLVLENHGHVAIISPGANVTSVRSLVSLVVQQLSNDSCQGTWCVKDSDDDHEDLPGISTTSSLKNFTPSTRSSYLALIEWYYSRIQQYTDTNVSGSPKFKTPAPPTTPRGGGGGSGRTPRSLSQPRLLSKLQQPYPDSPRPGTPRGGAGRGRRSSRFSSHRSTSHDFDDIKQSDSVPSTPDMENISMQRQRPSLKPLVIILTEIESIPTQVLCDFIELTSFYFTGRIKGREYALPINFVFGLSTTPEMVFESRINASTLSRLTIRRFAVPPPSAFMEVVMKEVIHFPGVHPTYSILSYLIDGIFLCLDYSVKNFLQRLKFCILEHYLKTPHPELLILPLDGVRQYLSSLDSKSLAQIVSIDYPSLANSVLNTEANIVGTADSTSSTSTPASPLPSSSSTCQSPSSRGRRSSHHSTSRLIDKIIQHLETHLKLQYLVPRVLNWLLIIISPVTVRPLGKNMSDLYRLWLKNGLTQSEEYTMTMNLFNGISKEAFVNAIHEAYAYLLNESTSCCSTPSTSTRNTSLWSSALASIESDGKACLTALTHDTLQWHNKLSIASQEPMNKPQQQQQLQQQSNESESSTPQSTKSFTGFNTTRKISLRNLRQHLQEFAAASPGRSNVATTLTTTRTTSSSYDNKTEWDITRKEFLQWIQAKLNELIPIMNKLPLHEVFYGPLSYDSSSSSSSPALTNTSHPSSIHSQSSLSSAAFIRRRLNPTYQLYLQQALINPAIYLQVFFFIFYTIYDTFGGVVTAAIVDYLC